MVGSASAQTGEYALLAAGDTLRGAVELRSPLLKRAYVRVDSQRVEIEHLTEFRDDGVLYAVVDGRQLASLVSEGDRVDFYARYETTHHAGAMVPTGAPGGGMHMTGGGVSTEQIGYFRLDGGPVERASAGNLRTALADNEESMAALNQHQKLTYAQYGGTAVGLGLFGVGTLLTLNSESGGEYTPSPLLFVGAGIASLSSLILPGQRRTKVQQAIDAYNE